MAKKKHAGKASPAKQTNYLGWIIAIVVIVVIAFFVFRSGEKEVTETTVAQEPVIEEKGAVVAAAAPEMNKKCKVATIGIVPGTKTVTDNVVTVTFKNAGRADLEGTYFEFSDGENSIYRKNTDVVAKGDKIEYTVDLSATATELGSAVKTFVVYPIEAGIACANQAVYVVS